MFRIRDNDRERTPRNGMVPNAEETGAFSAVRVANGDSKEVKFKKKNGGDEKELGQTNNGFHRDSIYRFTVNPMFSSPEARQGNARSEDEDGHLPISNAIYLPTNMSKLPIIKFFTSFSKWGGYILNKVLRGFILNIFKNQVVVIVRAFGSNRIRQKSVG